MSNREIEVGKILAGRYRIDRLRGKGGLGAVYEATDLQGSSNEQRVAIKVLLDLDATPKDEARFLQEAELVAQVKHPNVVALSAFVPAKSDDSEPAFIVMELIVDAIPLHRHIESAAPLPTDEALDLTKQILSALEAAHKVGVIHRDVKPANILVRFDDDTKKRKALLVDFGIGTMLGDRARVRTTTGVMLGTPGWAAPEQVRADENIDARVDIYGVGGCLYNMLTGRRAFTAHDMVRQLAGHPPPRVSSLIDGAPKWLDDLVAKALEADPAKRFASADVMLAVIEQHTTKPARPPPAARSFARVLLVTLGIGTIGLGGVLLLRPPSGASTTTTPTPPPLVLATDAAATQAQVEEQEPSDANADGILAEPSTPPPSNSLARTAAALPPPRCVCNGAKISFCDHPMPSQCVCVRANNALCLKVDPTDREKCSVQLLLGTPGAKCKGLQRYRSHAYEDEVEGTVEGCSRCYSPVESRRKYRGKNGDPCSGYDEDGVKQAGELSCLREEAR